MTLSLSTSATDPLLPASTASVLGFQALGVSGFAASTPPGAPAATADESGEFSDLFPDLAPDQPAAAAAPAKSPAGPFTPVFTAAPWEPVMADLRVAPPPAGAIAGGASGEAGLPVAQAGENTGAVHDEAEGPGGFPAANGNSAQSESDARKDFPTGPGVMPMERFHQGRPMRGNEISRTTADRPATADPLPSTAAPATAPGEELAPPGEKSRRSARAQTCESPQSPPAWTGAMGWTAPVGLELPAVASPHPEAPVTGDASLSSPARPDSILTPHATLAGRASAFPALPPAPVLPPTGSLPAADGTIPVPAAHETSVQPRDTDARDEVLLATVTRVNGEDDGRGLPDVNPYPDFSRSTPAFRSRPGGGENVAALLPTEDVPVISSRESSVKKFLTAGAEQVVHDRSGLGIDVAKSDATMPAEASNRRSAAVVPSAHALPALSIVPERTDSGAMPEFVSVAPVGVSRAVETVVSTIEHFIPGDRRAVNLQLAVGDADLGVRVELHGDQVRTTFRTDSAELRAALAQEWQAVSVDVGGRAVRLAEPVFASHSTGTHDQPAFGDGGAPRQHDAHQQPATDDFFVPTSRRRLSPPPVVEAVASAGRPAARPTSLHLETVA